MAFMVFGVTLLLKYLSAPEHTLYSKTLKTTPNSQLDNNK
jgi:hypothetical protein